MIRAAADFGIRAGRVEGLSGAWVGADKLGAIGVRISRWITSHGFALNVTTDLEYFNLIVPCGITSGGVTSLERAAGAEVNMADAEAAVAAHFSQVFARDEKNLQANCADTAGGGGHNRGHCRDRGLHPGASAAAGSSCKSTGVVLPDRTASHSSKCQGVLPSAASASARRLPSSQG